jgi:hypothetical protein
VDRASKSPILLESFGGIGEGETRQRWESWFRNGPNAVTFGWSRDTLVLTVRSAGASTACCGVDLAFARFCSRGMAKGDRWALGELVSEWAERGYFRLELRHSCIDGHGFESFHCLLWGEPGLRKVLLSWNGQG